MSSIIHFVSGLPRSGSTLLCNILAQNPHIKATATSGVLDLMLGVRNHWSSIYELRAAPNEEAKRRVLRGILENFHADTDQPVVLDKSRGWTSEIEMLECVLGRKVKIIVPVRDIRDVLASFERLWRSNHLQRNTLNASEYLQCQTVEGRCHYWLRNDWPLGIAHNRIRDALHRGFADRLHFVHFEELTAAPKSTLAEIYRFLDEREYSHDFAHIEQVTSEDDDIYRMGDLHTIRTSVTATESRWRELLGGFAESFAELNIWPSH